MGWVTRRPTSGSSLQLGALVAVSPAGWRDDLPMVLSSERAEAGAGLSLLGWKPVQLSPFSKSKQAPQSDQAGG